MIISSLETGQYIDVNDSFVRYTGYERHELIGRTSRELSVWVNPNDREQFIEMLRRDGIVTNYEAPYRKKSGDTGIGLVSSQFITLNNEQCLLSITRDITDYKQTQRRLTIAEEKSALYYEFLTNASHEFRTPLSIINSSLHIAEKSSDDIKRNKHLQKIGKQVTSLNKLIESLLLLARIDSDSFLTDEITHPTTLFDTTKQKFAHAIIEKTINFQISLESNLPKFRCNAKYLTLALYELVENAIEHSEAGSVIEMNAYVHESNLIMEVKDNGNGIDDDVLPLIFERFFRGDPARTVRGFGLGLSIAEKIAEFHDCEIRVSTHKKIGSSFQLLIPQKLLEF